VSHRADDEFRQRMQRVEGLLEEVERFPDAQARETTREVVQLLMDLHSAGLARAVELAAQQGEAGQRLLGAWARDELVASLLMLYGLHPTDVASRVRAALEQVRPSLERGGAEIELVALAEGALRLRLKGIGDSSPSSPEALAQEVEGAVWAAAPDLTSVEIEGRIDPSAAGRVPLPLLGAQP
jgi:Fe-S cluster biogenesis protein NfuA